MGGRSCRVNARPDTLLQNGGAKIASIHLSSRTYQRSVSFRLCASGMFYLGNPHGRLGHPLQLESQCAVAVSQC